MAAGFLRLLPPHLLYFPSLPEQAVRGDIYFLLPPPPRFARHNLFELHQTRECRDKMLACVCTAAADASSAAKLFMGGDAASLCHLVGSWKS